MGYEIFEPKLPLKKIKGCQNGNYQPDLLLIDKNLYRASMKKVPGRKEKKHVYETTCDSKITNHRIELNSFIQGLNETYSCEPCNRIFINEEKFMEHLKIIHKENHEKIDFQGVRHLSVHEEENPVLCDLCNIIFSSQEQFRTHFETMHEPKSTEDNNVEFAPSQQIK